MEEEVAGVPAAETAAAARTRGATGGVRADGGRKRSKRADQRGAAEPFVRGVPADARAPGLVDVPDANHEVAILTAFPLHSAQPSNNMCYSAQRCCRAWGAAAHAHAHSDICKRIKQIFSVFV